MGMKSLLNTRMWGAPLCGLLLLGGLSGCASSDAQAQVDAFCTKVEQLVREANQLARKPNAKKAGDDLAKTAEDLLAEAPALANTVVSNPGLAPRLQECASQLQGVGQG